ncbi:MAG: hypothetical protein CMH22_05555 [Methylophaga sp.]|nr:hypothetical protein [Methylophaga sp.]|tara:strand:+ start:114306 stop:114794 length:489 start_codon:yes stop_codon:yes gene_type:complete
MKKLIIFLILNLGFLSLEAQVSDFVLPDGKVIKVDDFYKPVLTDFIKSCAKYNIDFKRLSLLEGIYVSSNLEGRHGATRNDRKIILVNADIPNYLPTFRKAVLYHELYHLLSLENGHVAFPYLVQDGGSIFPEYLIKHWDVVEAEYFLYLASMYPNEKTPRN